MPHPYKFTDEKELSELLPEGRRILNLYLAQALTSNKDRVNIDRSTIRAFHLKKYNPKSLIGPLELYSHIALKIFNEKFKYFSKISNYTEYSEFIFESAILIVNEMNSQAMHSDFIKIGRATKLFNLTCKAMLRDDRLTSEQLIKLCSLAHVPLDSFTLQGICRLSTPFQIPSNASMGWEILDDWGKYMTLQKWLKDFCEKYDSFPLDYEAVAFHKSHN